jgi:hypothetical protein
VPKVRKKGEPKDIPPRYQTFLTLAQTDEDFRSALLVMYQKKKTDKAWKDMETLLVNDKVVNNKSEAQPLLDQIAKLKWDELYAMDQALGRGRDEDDFLTG